MEYPLVSVIVPIYGADKYLQECISSICRQSYTRLEIILVNDGSPDHCGEICDKNAAMDSRIIVVHKEYEGVSSARNTGLDIATGEYISFVDADDTIHPRFIEILLGLCEQYDCDIAQCDFLAVAEDSLKLELNSPQKLVFYDGKQMLHKLCCSADAVKYSVAWNKICKRNLFDGIRYPEGKINEDEFITYLIVWKAGKTVVTNEYLYYYLRHSASIMGSKFTVKRLDALDAFKERLCFLKEKGLDEDYLVTLRKLYRLTEKYYILAKENIEDYEEICGKLLKEKENIAKQLPEKFEKKEETFSREQLMSSCPWKKDARIVLYGAGKWGHIYYHFINEKQHGNIIGWVDNLWYGMGSSEFPVMPLDFIFRVSCDYVLIAVKSKIVQEEIKNNLISWGIEEEKILFIYSNES